ncbi:MAG: nucleoside kinase [Muribaculaceae bacterium]|nr:nucleoside kinase [Muribaculaceae bacterium]
MSENIKIFCVNNQKEIEVEKGSSVLEIFNKSGIELNSRVMGALVNNRTQSLNFRVYKPKTIEFFDYSSPHGERVYIHTLSLILYKAVTDIMPNAKLDIEHSISKGIFCRLSEDCGENTLAQINERMREIVEKDITIERFEEPTKEVIEKFRNAGMGDKVKLLSYISEPYTIYYKLDNVIDAFPYELTPSTGYISTFNFVKYSYGYLLVPPSKENPSELNKISRQDKLLAAFEEQYRFNNIAQLSNIGDLNEAITNGHAPVLIKVMEALHEKQIAKIADDIAQRFKLNGSSRVVLIAGPSSSGKTTFSKRLSVQLLTNLLVPVAISLDDYFVDRQNTPRDESGDYDYESIYALDLEAFNKDLNDLLEGKEVEIPTYNFETGTRNYTGKKLKLSPQSILILEGIHALNPQLTSQIEERMKFKIYVSALTSISIDDHNRIPTTDNRLLRRIIRDAKYRGTSAQNTIARWPSVRRGEEKWIFPFQENADAMFNTSLLYELSVICREAIPVLAQVGKDQKEYNEAKRLLNFLTMFIPTPEKEIPPTSLAREFLGGSSFIY